MTRKPGEDKQVYDIAIDQINDNPDHATCEECGKKTVRLRLYSDMKWIRYCTSCSFVHPFNLKHRMERNGKEGHR